MLLKQTIANVIPLTAELSNRNFVLTPVANTPIDYLVRETLDNSNLTINNDTKENGDFLNKEGVWEYLAEGIFFASRDDGDSIEGEVKPPCLHGEVLATQVEKISKAILEHITFAKQVITPQVSDLVERTNNDLASLSDRELNRFNIEVKVIPEVFKNPGLLSLIEPFGKINTNIFVETSAGLPQIDNDTLLSLGKLDIPSVDEELRTYFLVDDMHVLKFVWNTMLVDSTRQLVEYNGHGTSIQELLDDPKNGLAYCLALFVLSSQLIDNPLEGTSINLDAYNEKLSLMQTLAGQQLYRKLEGYHLQNKDGILVAAYNNNTCVVNQVVYEAFLEQGGTVETIFGQMLSPVRKYSLDEILADKEPSITRWKDHEAIQKSIEYNNRLYRTQRVLKENFELLLRDIGEVPNYSQLLETFSKEVNKVSIEDLEDIYSTALRLVTTTLYPNKGATKFLELMCSHEKMNPTLDPREIATLASIDYIGGWISEMINVNN